ncbi:EthD family reductase [Halobacteriales archaeon QS_4_69_34]|jgi:uncharacterized protein (TIGR02118 family)|nr:MAG: EthD family reductase [Halobacteriales archaeon QS_4_69_34]
MYKAMFALNRAEGTSHEEFARHWQDDHAPIAIEGVPDLLKYTISFPDDPDSAAYDGVAELYFEDEATCREGLDSEAMGEAVADVPNFADPNDVLQLMVEEHVQVDRT